MDLQHGRYALRGRDGGTVNVSSLSFRIGIVLVSLFSPSHLSPFRPHELRRFIPVPVEKNGAGHASVLALLGDIGAPATPGYRSLIAWAAGMYDHVLVVAGNHEYYQERNQKRRTMAQLNAKMQEVCAEIPNAYFLEHGVVEIEGVTFLGAALWSEVMPFEEFPDEEVASIYWIIEERREGYSYYVSFRSF